MLAELRPVHVLLVLFVVLLLFGTKRLPDLARSVGKSLKILKTEVKDLRDDPPPTATVLSAAAAPAATQLAAVTAPDLLVGAPGAESLSVAAPASAPADLIKHPAVVPGSDRQSA